MSALVYPAILISLALAMVTFIVLKVVPAFQDFYGTFRRQQKTAVEHAGDRLARCRSSCGRSSCWCHRRAGRDRRRLPRLGAAAGAQQARFDHLLLGLPMLGNVAKKFATSQMMARTLATLLGGGLPLVNALEIAAKSVGNRYMAAQLDIVSARVREGESFAGALEARRVFPEVAVKMAEVGESTGALQEMLNTVADFYDEDIATTMDRFVTLVEPVLLIVMGLVIAGLVLALYMPLFQLSSVLAG